jgi:hypothetical protein
VSYEIAFINPRKAGKRKATPAQIRARKAFAAKFGGKKSTKTKKRRATRPARRRLTTNSGVPEMAKRKHKRRPAARKASAPKRRRVTRRKSGGTPSSLGYTVGSGPIRRRKLNPRRVHRKRYKRNPMGLGSVKNIVTGQLLPAAYGAGGAVVLNLALSYLPLPDAVKTGWPRHGVRLVGALAVGWAARKFVKGSTGNAMAAGALIVVVYDIVKAALAQFAPEIGSRLGEFEDVSIDDPAGIYDPATLISGTGALLTGPDDNDGVDGDLDGMGALLQGDLDGVAY